MAFTFFCLIFHKIKQNGGYFCPKRSEFRTRGLETLEGFCPQLRRRTVMVCVCLESGCFQVGWGRRYRTGSGIERTAHACRSGQMEQGFTRVFAQKFEMTRHGERNSNEGGDLNEIKS
jgi:hypothetical protein